MFLDRYSEIPKVTFPEMEKATFCHQKPGAPEGFWGPFPNSAGWGGRHIFPDSDPRLRGGGPLMYNKEGGAWPRAEKSQGTLLADSGVYFLAPPPQRVAPGL